MSSGARVPALYLFGGLAVAAVSLVLAAVAGGPYLSLQALNPWLAVFAVGLFVALFATPFAIHRGLGGLLEADARWERALLWWGAVSLGVLGLGLLCGLASGFASDSLAGSIGLVAVGEAVMVLATLVVWLLAG
jgi:membrane protease YdiL (CAAX protease family)